MSIWDALLLGLVEGITEFLPVSSTGHLIVAQRMLGISASKAANSYNIVIQIGAILAVLRLYGSRLHEVIEGLRGRSELGRRLLVCLLVAFGPAVIVGLTLEETIDAYLFGPIPVVAAWIVGGVVILWWSGKQGTRAAGQPLEAIQWKAALGIGLIQCLAMWPGTSRSFMTIMGGVAVGLSLPAAVEFSFLLGVLTLGAASCYSGLKNMSSLSELGLDVVLVGIAASFVSAYLAVRWMVDWINRRGLAVFGYWRIAAGILVGGLVAAGWM